MSESVNGGELRAIIERIESVNSEIADRVSDRKEIFGEAKGGGYDIKIIRKIVAMRKQDRDKREQEEAVTALYTDAIGMN